MKTLSAVFTLAVFTLAVLTLAVASMAPTTIEALPPTGIAEPEADRVEPEAGLARLGSELTVPSADRFLVKIAQAGLFKEEWSLQDR